MGIGGIRAMYGCVVSRIAHCFGIRTIHTMLKYF